MKLIADIVTLPICINCERITRVGNKQCCFECSKNEHSIYCDDLQTPKGKLQEKAHASYWSEEYLNAIR